MSASVALLAERALRRLGVAIVPETDRPGLAVTIPAPVIASNALVELGVIAADEVPQTPDQNLAFAKVSAVHDALVAQAIARWTIHSIPQAVSEEYTKLAAVWLASSFGKAADPQMVPVLEARVRKTAMIMQAPDEAATAVVAVHRSLTARGLARWSVFDIPDAVEEPYVMLAANQLAPSFGMQADPAAAVGAAAMLAKVIALPTSGERVPVEYF